uniref:Uncharacterized protein n=1 Tax=Rhizophagus irregularis (strain DAOM 181602 / DAOM 197198 / MUCL 43194) TaxID=747089 RepID=U9TEZ2_RHIID
MATVALGLPIFEGREDENFNQFIKLYKEYLHSFNINPADASGGPLASYEKVLSILRTCLKGHAAEWYDNNILGKNVRLRNILVLVTAAAPNHVLVANSVATQYQQGHNNAGNFMTEIWPDYEINRANNDIWRDRAGMELTDANLNFVTAAGIIMNVSGAAQIWELQKNLRQPPVRKPPVQPVQPKPQKRVIQQKDYEYYEGVPNEHHDVGDDPDAPEWTLDDHQNAIDLIMGLGMFKRLAKKLQKTKDRCDDLELFQANEKS